MTLHIFGEGPMRAELRHLAATLDLRLVMHGLISETELVAAYGGGDCVLICTSRFEGYSVAVVEAAACGVPVVGLAAPGVERAIRACGGVVSASPQELPRAVLQAFLDGNGQSARSIAESHSESTIGLAFWHDLGVV